jgi:D-lactate dehydrogenase
MRVTVFSAKAYDRVSLDEANGGRHDLVYLEPHLDAHTAALAGDSTAVCVFVNDTVSAPVIDQLAELGVRLIALRCAGFNNVDLGRAAEKGITVARVPAYSPYAVAEHAVAIILTLNRKTHRAFNRVREGNFALDGLLGFDLHGKTVGVVGTGKIGAIFAKLMIGFGCRVLAYDPYPNDECVAAGVEYRELNPLLAESDIVSLHCPLTPSTKHVVGATAIEAMKPGVMLINTSRGALVDTRAAIEGLKSGKIAYLGIDVYEEEGDLFFEDLSGRVIQDDVFARLTTFPNVLVTAHQAFFTREAMGNIADTTIGNLTEFESTGRCANAVTVQKHSARA